MLVAVFIETVDTTNYWLLRDADAIDLLSDQTLNLAFIGTDKLGELAIDEIEVIETVYEQRNIPQFVLAGLFDRIRDIPTKLAAKRPLSVATSYPNALARFASQSGLALNVTDTPKGSVEAYAKSKRVDLVFDIKQSGKTLTDNSQTLWGAQQ